jgi:hypothetical protein
MKEYVYQARVEDKLLPIQIVIKAKDGQRAAVELFRWLKEIGVDMAKGPTFDCVKGDSGGQ